jgi:hypothetical protein
MHIVWKLTELITIKKYKLVMAKVTKIPIVITLSFEGDLTDDEVDNKLVNLDYSMFIDGEEIPSEINWDLEDITRIEK